MNEYIERMIRCGLSPCNAYVTYHQFLNNYRFSTKELEEFIEDLEKDKFVIQEDGVICG